MGKAMEGGETMDFGGVNSGGVSKAEIALREAKEVRKRRARRGPKGRPRGSSKGRSKG